MRMQLAGGARQLAMGALIIGFIATPGRASAQVAVVMPILINVAAWMGEKIADHYLGKALDSTDKALGEKHEETLKAARSQLQSIDAPTAQDRQTIKSISNQISLLNDLLKQQAGTDPKALQDKLQAELTAMHASLSDRDRKVDELQTIVDQLQRALAQSPNGPRPPIPTPSPPVAAVAAKPSFDCNKATTFVEKEICGNPRLADTDAQLGRVYWSAYNRLPQSEKDQLRHEELAWLRQRDYLLNSVCMRPTGHLDTDCAIFFWNQRIADLPRA